MYCCILRVCSSNAFLKKRKEKIENRENRENNIENKTHKTNTYFFLRYVFPQKLRFSLGFLGPERFKKLREACRKIVHLVAPPKTSVVTSYDQKP